jgi:hypothetical protein
VRIETPLLAPPGVIGGAGSSGQVFDIVDLERETQAAASWRWRNHAISTLTIAVS